MLKGVPYVMNLVIAVVVFVVIYAFGGIVGQEALMTSDKYRHCFEEID